MFALLDSNNFFASCERAFNPKIKNLPVVVLSNNDGCIIARSQEAKALGIKMGEPYFKVKNFLKLHNVKVFSANYPLYGDMSRRIMQILMEFVPEVEIYSIDEAFLRLDALIIDDIEKFVKDLVDKIEKWTSIPVTIGIAKTKTLSKLATEYAKNILHKKVFILDDKELLTQIMQQTPVDEVWGIGRRWAKKFYQYFVYTIWDFVQLSDDFLLRKFNVMALRLKQELLGKPIFAIDEQPDNVKSIRRSRSFGILIEKYDDMQEAIANFADSCAEKLNKLGLVANNIFVYLRTDPYRKDLPQYRNSISITLSSPTDSNRIIIAKALQGLKRIYRENYKYRKAGVVVSGLETKNSIQISLFDSYNKIQEEVLNKTIRNIRKKYGKKKIFFSTQIGSGNWKPRQFHISHEYTTNWDELLKVK